VSPLDRAVLAERVSALERHLARVADRLPATPEELAASRDRTDAVILHLWQATQIAIDLAVSACAVGHLGTPQGYGDAFRRLEAAGVVDRALASRLVKAVGLSNVVAHAYDTLDLARVHAAATHGPADLRTFVTAALPRLLGS